MRLPDGFDYDYYAFRVGRSWARRFALGGRVTWYTKFRLEQDEVTGDFVYVIGLHLLEKPQRVRNGGPLTPDRGEEAASW